MSVTCHNRKDTKQKDKGLEKRITGPRSTSFQGRSTENRSSCFRSYEMPGRHVMYGDTA